jgi:hypothetical protein
MKYMKYMKYKAQYCRHTNARAPAERDATPADIRSSATNFSWLYECGVCNRVTCAQVAGDGVCTTRSKL